MCNISLNTDNWTAQQQTRGSSNVIKGKDLQNTVFSSDWHINVQLKI